MQTFTDDRPPLPATQDVIYPEDIDRPIFCVRTDRGNFKTFLIPHGTTWLAPCEDPGPGQRLVCFISVKPAAGEGLQVNLVNASHIKTTPKKVW